MRWRPTGRPYRPVLHLHDRRRAALARAADDGWTVVSVKDDWATVFADA